MCLAGPISERTAVDKATPTTEPNARIKLRVEVATARSWGLERAWIATRAVASVSKPSRLCRVLTWLKDKSDPRLLQ